MAENGIESVSQYKADLAAAWRKLAGTYREPLTLGVYARCMCRGANYTDGGRCKECGAFPMADWEWDLLTGNVNGFMESDAWASFCHGDGQDDYGNTCTGYADSEFPCTKCCAQNAVHNPAGLVESKELPITITLYRGTKTIVIKNVREDSVTVKESTIPGYVNVEYETYGNDTLGYVPMVDYFETECTN